MATSVYANESMNHFDHSYPPSVSSASLTSTQHGTESVVSSTSNYRMDMITALRDGPPRASSAGSTFGAGPNNKHLSIHVPSTSDKSRTRSNGEYSPPLTSTSSSFQSEAPLFKQRSSDRRMFASDSSQHDVSALAPVSPTSHAEDRRGSQATDTSIFNSEDNESRRSSLPNDWRASFTSDMSHALPPRDLPRQQSRQSIQDRRRPSVPATQPREKVPKPLASPPLQPLSFKANPPVGSPRSFSMAHSKSRSPSAALSSPQYFTRSLITVNPFSAFRRRLANKETEEHQVLLELLAALEEYVVAFEAESTSFAPKSPQPMPARLLVPPDRLVQITDEIDSLVDEMCELLPEFQTALSKGGYGSLAVGRAQRASFRASADRYEAFEPTSDELRMGHSWVQRLAKDLVDTSGELLTPLSPQLTISSAMSSPLVRTDSPRLNQISAGGSNLGAVNDPLGIGSSALLANNKSSGPVNNSSQSPLIDVNAEQMERTDSARSIELLAQGTRRWLSYVEHSSPRMK